MDDPLNKTEEKSEEQVSEDALIEASKDRLERTFSEQPLADPNESIDTTPAKEEDEELEQAAASDDEDGPTPAEEAAEAALEAKEKASIAKQEEVVEVDKTKLEDQEEDDSHGLPDGYVRAAIHRGFKKEEIDELYGANPELAERTLSKIYEAVNRSTSEFASLGRAAKKAESESEPPRKKEAAPAAKSEDTLPVIDIEKLKADYDKDDPMVNVVELLIKQNNTLQKNYEEVKQNQVAQPVVNAPDPGPHELDYVTKQIDTFFTDPELSLYTDFYGVVPTDDPKWTSLTERQQTRRVDVINMAQDIIVGARATSERDMSVDEGLRLAHMVVAKDLNESIIIKKIKSKVIQRSKSLSLKPNSAAASQAKDGPKSEESLISDTAARLAKTFN